MITFTRTEHLPARMHVDDIVGIIPEFLSEHDPRPAKEQFNENYSFGGGWRPFEGFEFNPETKTIQYPEDPEYLPMATGMFRDEEIIVYSHAWVLILQKDGSWEVSRMD